MKKTILLLIGLVALNFQNQAQTVSDKDGNVYNTVTIGTQTWLKENLKTTKYNDGSSIPLIIYDSIWIGLTTPAYCNYKNTNNTDTINTYGRLYNWYSINSGKLCPTGWHVPSDSEWTILSTYLGGDDIAGGKLKESGNAHWIQNNSGSDNSSGFTALPAGYRSFDEGHFSSIGTNALFWSATESNSNSAYRREMYSFTGTNYLKFARTDIYKVDGHSIRCLQGSLPNNIEKIYNNSLNIFPNPAMNIISINCKEICNNLTIYNIVGKLIYQKQLDNGRNEIDISNLQPGIYVIKIENEKGTMQQKLIKQ